MDADLSGRKLMIGIPAYDAKVSTSFAAALMQLGQLCMAHGVSLSVSIINGCSVIARARNLVVSEFMESDADHLMFIDADMTWQPEDVLRLLARNRPDRGIVAGCYVTRQPVKVYCVRLENEPYFDDDGLLRVKRVATGFMMIHRQVFAALRNQDWMYWERDEQRMACAYFDHQVTPEEYVGEDFLFCDRASCAGFPAWVDPQIKLGHIGTQEHASDFMTDIVSTMRHPVLHAA